MRSSRAPISAAMSAEPRARPAWGLSVTLSVAVLGVGLTRPVPTTATMVSTSGMSRRAVVARACKRLIASKEASGAA